MKQDREYYLDLLRLISLMCVIGIHIGARLAGNFPAVSIHRFGIKFWDMTWAVPCFVMISGGFFLDLDKKITVSSIYSKYIKRLVVAFVFWTIVYEIRNALSGDYQLNLKGYIYDACMGSATHMWYLFMIIGLYMLTPLLRKLVDNKKDMEYYLFLFFLFQLIKYFGTELPFIGTIISTVLDKMNFFFVFGYTGYFLYGYYVKKYDMSKKNETRIYALGGISFVFMLVADSYLAYKTGTDEQFFSKYLSPTTILYSIAVYTFFVKRVSGISFSDTAKKWLNRITEYGLGMYLVHYLIVWFVPMEFTKMFPLVTIPVTSVLILGVSYLISCILRRIPVIGRYIV